jgi:preprotein translocase subunit SecB
MGNMIRILGMPDVNLATGGSSVQLDVEITARVNADSTLQGNINQESTSRVNADSTLQTNIDFEQSARSDADIALTTNLNAEITARKNADSTLTANLNTEITARSNGDSTLQVNLNLEVTARVNADSTLQNNLDLEITARSNADSTLQNNLDLEITARSNADSTLTSNLNSEITARTNADSTLQTAINNIVQGDSSFYLKSIVGSTLTIASGFLLTASGTEFWVASDLSYLLTPTSDGNYYACLDLLSFDSATPVSINGRTVYQVIAANIALLTSPATNYSRYAPLGTIQRVSGIWVNQQTTAKFRHDDVVIGADGSLEYSLPFTSIATVGTAGQIRAGHVLATSSFPSAIETTYSFYNLSSVFDGTANARNLTNNGSVLFTGADILGSASCVSLDGATQWLSSTSSFFNTGDNEFTCGGWFKPVSYTSGLQTLFGQWSAVGNLSFMIRLTAAGQLEVYGSTDGTNTVFTTLDPLVTSGWMHVVVRYAAALDTLTVFVNDVNVGSLSVTLATVTTPNFSIGCGAGNNYFAGTVDEFFFASLLLSDNAITKMHSYKLTHNRLLSPQSQRWYFWGLYDSQTRQIADPIIDIDPSEVWWDLSNENYQNQVAVKLHNVSSLGYSKPTKARTLEMMAAELDALLPITHSLGIVPEISFKTQNIGGDYEFSSSLPFVATATQIKYSGPPATSLASTYGSSTICVLNYSTTALSLYLPSLVWNTYTSSSSLGYLSRQDQVFWDTTLGICTAVLPVAPSLGDMIRLIDFKGTWNTNNLIVQRNGNKIQGVADDLYLDIPWDSCTLVFDGIDDWHIIF